MEPSVPEARKEFSFSLDWVTDFLGKRHIKALWSVKELGTSRLVRNWDL